MTKKSGVFTEDQLVEQPAIQLFEELGWETINAYHETLGPGGTLGRDNRSEVFLATRLRAALQRLNPGIPAEAIEHAVTEITRARTALHYARANAEIHHLLRNRVEVPVRQPDGTTLPESSRSSTGTSPRTTTSCSSRSSGSTRTCTSGGPISSASSTASRLVFIELKASHHNLKHAFDDNLSDYRDTIPQIFTPNGSSSSPTAPRPRSARSRRRGSTSPSGRRSTLRARQGVVSLETVIRGMCTKERLLDIIENFIAFQDLPGGFVKLLARNHQYLGVNNALARMDELRHAPADERGRLGVFWHTQGSGKTLSMIFFSQKVLRKRPGNWTFVIVTDREDLDDQAYTRVRARRGRQREERPGDAARRTSGSCWAKTTATFSPSFRSSAPRRVSAHPALSERDRRHRHHRRGPPHPVRHPRAEHA